jgi:phosphoribosylformylglycinamidine synthase
LIYIDLSDGKYELGGSSFAQMMNKLGTATPNVCDPAYFAHVFEVIQALIQQETILAGHDISAGGMITTLLEMTFTSNTTGLDVNLSSIGESDIIQLLFSENPGLILQVEQNSPVPRELEKQGIIFHTIGTVTSARNFSLVNQQEKYCFDIDSLRDLWFKTSYLLDRSQCGPEQALHRYRNFKNQPLAFRFNPPFTGLPAQYGFDPARRTTSGIKAAIIREKGVNGDREMAWSLHLAGFDVKDVHMTDLISGREILEELNLIVFVGGFSNSDVLGSGRGWAGAFLYNEKARETLDRFYARADTLSLGICNGCQVMMELGLVYPEFRGKARMLPNSSGKFESSFLNVDIMDNPSVMLGSMAGSRLGIWVAHGEGRFELPGKESDYIIPVKFSYPNYPGNPNGSDFQAAALVSRDGRHLVMMPHIERAIYPWQWANYPEERRKDIVSPWIEAFVNAREWIKSNT